jgi:hypothetical protein
MGSGDGGDLRDGGELVDEVLHLLSGDLLLTPVDHVLVPALDHEVAVGRAPADVAGAVPAVLGERALVLLVGTLIAPRGIGAHR